MTAHFLCWIKQHTHVDTQTHQQENSGGKTTGFTMSVGRLAEPPKPSFLLLSKVSQSHPFMCNACKPMHLDTTAQRRDIGVGWGGDNGLLLKQVRADKHHRTTTVFEISISSNESSRS